MPNKALTLLIADEQHLQRLYIEKMLNQLGYYRIVPVQTFDEVLVLTDIPAAPFDVLIINAGLAADGEGMRALQRNHAQVRHVLIYENNDLAISSTANPAVLVRLPGAVDSVSLEHFMDIIDPPSPYEGLRVLPWLRELSRNPAA